CGLTVMVAPGLALDGCGDPLQLVGSAAIDLKDKDGVIPPDKKTPPKRTDFWVIACGKEKPCAPRALVCDGDDLDSAPQPTRTRSAVEVSIAFEAPECVCGCNRFDPKGTPGEQLKSVEDRIDAIDRQKQDDEHDPTKPYVCGMDPYDCYTDHYAKW